MRRTSRGSSTSAKWVSSADRRDFRGRVSAEAIMRGSESGPPHRFREKPPCHLSYEFGALPVTTLPLRTIARTLIGMCDSGEMPEWSNGAVSKTVEGATPPRVRIPLSPPATPETLLFLLRTGQPRGTGTVFARFPLTAPGLRAGSEPVQPALPRLSPPGRCKVKFSW